jgi:hypothetical protein
LLFYNLLCFPVVRGTWGNMMTFIAFWDYICKSEGIIPLLMLNAWAVWMCLIYLICLMFVLMLTRPACCVNCMLSSGIRYWCRLFQVCSGLVAEICLWGESLHKTDPSPSIMVGHLVTKPLGSSQSLISGPPPCIHCLLTVFFYKNLLSLGLSTWDLFSAAAFICHLLFWCCQRNQLFVVPQISYLHQLSDSTIISFLCPGLGFSSLFIY